MEYKLISMDFDGTLLTSQKSVTEYTKKALLRYRNKKYIIVGITARTLSSASSACDINMFDYLILNNGSYIYDAQNKKLTNLGKIDKSIQIELMDDFKNIAKQIDFCTLNKYCIYTKSDIERNDLLVKIENINEINEIVSRINIFLPDDKDINKYKKFIEDNFKNLEVFYMTDIDHNKSRKWLSLNPKETNKLKALEKLCLTLKIKTKDVIFFGDGLNDLELISNAGLGVAMANASNEVKAASKEIALSNDEDGIAKFLESNNF